MNENEITLKLSIPEYRMILESLLFSSSTDVTANFYREDCEKMKSFLYELRCKNPHILTENVEIIVGESFDTYFDDDVDEILKHFPEILRKEKDIKNL